ncbi:MAG: hypothetical protein AABY83_13175 [Pseudomonadota bacterium]
MPNTQQTNATGTFKQKSEIVFVRWARSIVHAKDSVNYEVVTALVGNGAEITLLAKDAKGKVILKEKGQVYGGKYFGKTSLPESAQSPISLTAELPKHQSKKNALPLTVLPAITVSSLKWDRTQVRRKEKVTLSGCIIGYKSTNATLTVYRFSEMGAHIPVARIPVALSEGKFQAGWEFTFKASTALLATNKELKKHGESYSKPSYFFCVSEPPSPVKSNLMEFIDEIKIRIVNPIKDVKYEIITADDKENAVAPDGRQVMILKDVAPGRGEFKMTLPDTKK